MQIDQQRLVFRVYVASAGEHVVGGGAAAQTGLSGPPDGAGDRGDPPAVPGQAAAHPGRHRGQKAPAAELLKEAAPGV